MTRLVLLALCAAAAGCASPYQTARMLAPGQTRVAAAASSIHLVESGESDDEESIEAIDLLVDHGVSDEVEVNARYSNYGDLSDSANLLLVGAKLRLAPDRLAIHVPIGVVWADDDIGGYVIHPRLIGSLPAGANAELVGSLGLLLVIPDEEGGDSEYFLGGSIGVRLSTDLDVWAIQPELGLLHHEEGNAISVGAAVSFTL